MIRTKLMPHQRLIVDFCSSREYSAMFAEYGTGKTLAALAIAHRIGARKIFVISTKTSVESTWPSEIERHTDFRYVNLMGTTAQKLNALSLGLRTSYMPESHYTAEKKRPVIFLLNFDGIKNIYEELCACNPDMLIVDESTKIKDPRTIRAKVMWGMAKSAKVRIIMTGWPITENIQEIYSQIKFLDFGEALGNNYYRFTNNYFYRAGFKWKPKKGSERKILNLIKPFTIRITSDTLHLPPKVYKKELIRPSKQQARLLDELNSYFRMEFGRVKIDTHYIFVILNKSLQICDGFVQDDKGRIEVLDSAKDETLLETVDEIDPIKNKIVIWTIFRYSVSKIEKMFKSLGYNVLTLTGATEDIDSVVRKFQHSKQHNILVATQKKAGESITLTACKYAIYYSNLWSYDLRANSEARIRRKGSEHHKSIVYTDLILKGTIEELVYKCLREKKSLIDKMKKLFVEGEE
jgi:SNF2 family DNA or RNA helicase